MVLKRVGHTIAREIERQKLSVESLAQRSKLARSTIREIIAGRSDPRLLSLCSLAEALGYSGIVDFLEQAGRP